MSRLKRWKRPIQLAFLALALLFIGLLILDQWQALRAYEWHLRPGWLALSGLALALSWLLEVSVWRRLLRIVGGELSYARAWRIWFLSAITRYMPGNIWQPLSMTVMGQEQGVRAMATVTSIVAYQLVNLMAAAFIAAVYFPLTGNLGLLTALLPPGVARWMALLALPLLLFLARPGWLVQMINWILRKMGRSPLPLHLNTPELLRALALTTLVWLLLGVSFLFLTAALSDSSPAAILAQAVHLIAAYPLSYAAGYISFITPSGLGVREGVAYLLLTPLIGGATATIAALAMRLWLMLGELVAAGAGLLVRR